MATKLLCERFSIVHESPSLRRRAWLLDTLGSRITISFCLSRPIMVTSLSIVMVCSASGPSRKRMATSEAAFCSASIEVLLTKTQQYLLLVYTIRQQKKSGKLTQVDAKGRSCGRRDPIVATRQRTLLV